jgi:hypothetical protein
MSDNPDLPKANHALVVIRQARLSRNEAAAMMIEDLIYETPNTPQRARGTFRLSPNRGSVYSLEPPKRFAASSRPRNLRERNWPKPKMSARARSILICRSGRSPQRNCFNGSKNRMKPI